jgi:hypothetical protein
MALQYATGYSAAPIPECHCDALTWRRSDIAALLRMAAFITAHAAARAGSNGIFCPQRTSRYYFSLSAVSDDGKSLPPSKNLVGSCVGRVLFNPPLDCEMAG